MFYITDRIIQKLAANQQVYQRGLLYFRQNRVVDLQFNKKNLFLQAIVAGQQQYQVGVGFSDQGKVIDMYCECQAFYQYEGACKHIVALLKACQHRYEGGLPKNKVKSRDPARDSRLAEELLTYLQQNYDEPEKVPVDIEITLEFFYESGRPSRIQPALTMRLGEGKLYIVKSIKNFIEDLSRLGDHYFGKRFTFSPHMHTFKPEDQAIIDFLFELYELEEKIVGNSWYPHSIPKIFSGKQVVLTQSAAQRLLALLPSGKFHVRLLDQAYMNVQIMEQDLPLRFALEKKNNDLVLRWDRQNISSPLVQVGKYLFHEGVFYKISRKQKKIFSSLIHTLPLAPDGIRFQKQQRERLVAEVLPAVRQVGQVEIAPAVQDSFYETDLRAEIYLDREGDAITARVEFTYGEIRFNPFTNQSGLRAGAKILVRDQAGERAVLNLFEQAEFRTLNGSLYLKQEEAIFAFVHQILPQIQQLAEVFYSESFRKMRVRDTRSFSGGVRLSEDSGLLEFSFEMEDIDYSELGAIFQSLREKKKYYRLKDGSFLQLDAPEASLEQMMHMLDSLDVTERDWANKVVKIPKYRALYIDRCLKEANLHFTKNMAFKQLVQDIREPRELEFEVPGNFQGVLRDYQKVGFKWLKALAMYGLGGILADDMGLGKTVQAIAFILSEKERVQAPSLVVAPTSVVYNWQDEAQKFAPDLRVVVVSGTPREREMLLGEARKADLVITSYALIRRDVELYADFNFGYCFLDEAQHIKNPNALVAKAVKLIKARGYFVLTGTPLENSLTELWSIFDFVMRGYLFNHTKFMKKYERPIISNQDQRVLQELKKQIAPFILRRMKRDVLQELPPKIESKVLTELTREQKKIYLTYLEQARGEIAEAINNRGFEQSQIKILAVLTRLRQICCHPATFLEEYKGDSGKLMYLRENLQDAIASGHRILLFSQFTGMLGIIQKLLESEKINYFYLDGSTNAETRGQMVRSFNRGDGDVFLISLKAGGTGLNLTGADMVIHYDPWWNPAVEEQATDRAYRIGQKNSVQVIKLITKGTIEEKIYELQQKKKAMIDSVIQPGETMLSKMTEQDIRELLEGK